MPIADDASECEELTMEEFVMSSATNASFLSETRPVTAMGYRVEPHSTGTPNSHVYKEPKGWEEVVFPYEGIRFLMHELHEAVHAMDPSSAWKWQNLSLWYQEYFHDVVHHYDIEEQIYLPWIQAHATVPNQITVEHHELMQTLDVLRDMIRDGAAMSIFERAEHLAMLRKRVLAFSEAMNAHLAEEARVIPSLLREAKFSKEDEYAVVGQIIASLELEGNQRALPTMVRDLKSRAGSEQAEEPESQQLPFHSDFFDFQQRHIGLLASLGKGIDDDPFAWVV